jgi:hypothetical protein
MVKTMPKTMPKATALVVKQNASFKHDTKPEDVVSFTFLTMICAYPLLMNNTSSAADQFFRRMKKELILLLKQKHITPPKDLKIIVTKNKQSSPLSKKPDVGVPDEEYKQLPPLSKLFIRCSNADDNEYRSVGILWNTKNVSDADDKSRVSYNEILKMDVHLKTRTFSIQKIVSTQMETAKCALSRADETASILLRMAMN